MNSGDAPQATVVLAVSDDSASERLEAAIASVRAQEPAPPPIVVVDTASTNPLPLLPGAWVIRASSGLSLGAARNLGLTRVTTPYVVFWDADDIMLPGTLAALEAVIANNLQLVAFGMAILEERSRNRHRWPPCWIARLVGRPQIFALLHSVWPLFPSTGATIMRTDLARAAGGYGDADSGEGWPLGVSLAFRGQVGWSERAGRLYRVHRGSLQTQDMTPKDLQRHARAIRARIRSDGGIPEWVRAALPLIFLGQWAAIGAHAGLEALRRRLQGVDRLTPVRR